MPTSTFFNLPDEKRQRILNSSIDEFAKCSPEHASIARIIDRAGIPRGSFYQYFTDIQDMYHYVITIISNEKMEYLQEILDKMDELNVFQIFRLLYQAGIKFAHDNPRLAAIGTQFFKDNRTLGHGIFQDMEEKSLAFFQHLLTGGQIKGEIDPQVDIQLAAYMLHSLNLDLMEYYLAQGGEEEVPQDFQGYLSLVDPMLFIIENGLKAR